MSIHCPPEILALLLRLNLFRGLDEAELVLLLAQAEMIDVNQNDYPVREGEQGQHLFVVLAGEARISKRSFGIQKVIQKLGPGECFGEMSLIECRPRSASVRAITPCKLLKIKVDDMLLSPATSAKLYRNIAILLSQRLRHANEIVTLG